MKATEHTIGTIIKPAIKKTGYVKRNIVEFSCGKFPNWSEQVPKGMEVQSSDLRTFKDDVITNQGLYKAVEAVRT